MRKFVHFSKAQWVLQKVVALEEYRQLKESSIWCQYIGELSEVKIFLIGKQSSIYINSSAGCFERARAVSRGLIYNAEYGGVATARAR